MWDFNCAVQFRETPMCCRFTEMYNLYKRSKSSSSHWDGEWNTEPKTPQEIILRVYAKGKQYETLVFVDTNRVDILRRGAADKLVGYIQRKRLGKVTKTSVLGANRVSLYIWDVNGQAVDKLAPLLEAEEENNKNVNKTSKRNRK